MLPGVITFQVMESFKLIVICNVWNKEVTGNLLDNYCRGKNIFFASGVSNENGGVESLLHLSYKGELS